MSKEKELIYWWHFVQMDRKNRTLMKFPNDFENLSVEEQKVSLIVKGAKGEPGSDRLNLVYLPQATIAPTTDGPMEGNVS